MDFSRPTSLNPNADPFLYSSPFIVPPPKLEFAPVPIPIFKTPPHLRQLPVVAPSRVVWAPPMHGYACYVDSYQHHQHHQHHPMFGFYDVVPQVPSWPCSDAFSHPLQDSVGNNVEMKIERNKCKIIKKQVPQVRVRVRDETIRFPSAAEVMPMETTTLMIKNIPNQLRQDDLLNILDEHCKWKNLRYNHMNNSFDSRRSEYDFVYLPMDFRKYWYDGKISNLGYAFVNFTSPTAASEFCKAFHRRHWEVVINNKVCEVKRAKLQGLKALMEAFRNKIFWCHANNFLPVVLEPPSDGCRRYRATSVGKRIARPPPNPIKKCG